MASSSTPTDTEEQSPSELTNTTYFNMDEELENLVASFEGQVRVLDAVKSDRFIKTVKINPNNLDIIFSFNLPHGYPDSGADIDVRSDSVDEEDLYDLKLYLKQSVNTPRTLQQLVDIALQWLKEGNIDISGKKMSKSQQAGKKNSKYGKKKSKKKDEVERGKKPPMKTAIDVVKRILWDRALQQDQFLVGYIDRMDGLKEKYFNAFSWEDIASVDYTVLAIPKHRIQYFKYKGEIVWDKRCRLDNVFGSTGSKITITDVMARIDGVSVNVDLPEGAEAEPDNVGEVEDYPDSDYNSEDYTDTDSDSEDGIEVTIDNGDVSRGMGRLDFDEDNTNVYEDGENADQYDKYWRDKLRPNHFIALRIDDEQIQEVAESIQDQVIANEPRLENCKIPKAAMHLTLCTMGLETPEQVENAVKCLDEAISELKDIMPKDKLLTFKGVETFFNRVIYGRVIDCPPEFFDLVEHLKTCLAAKGIDIRDYHEFVPHMTIMKVSRPVAKLTGNNYIAPWLYSSFNDTVLGSQCVNNLHLCAMSDDRQKDGFYKTATSYQW